jgi:MSHA biogenesis protein MshQ
MRRLHLLALPVLLALLALLAPAARADTPLALWKTVDGRVNFTGTQVTLRTKPNSTSSNRSNTAACTVTLPGTDRTAYLGLPAGATVLSAQLYWAGSGTPDSTVKFEKNDVTASRKYTSGTVGGGFNYFGGAADVTETVRKKGSGTYTFSGLTVANGAPWCASQGVLGGFSLLVVYAHPSEPERVLNLYEGFRYVQNGEVTVKATNFRWNRTYAWVKEKARIGHISWEGDPTLAQDGERLLFEGTEMTDSLNPEGNQFNSRSNINNDGASYGIDFDAYDTSVIISAYSDAAVTTRYRTGQDLVILNAEVLVLPTMPVSDLSIALTRNTALKVGADAQYTVTVANNGPYTEAGVITVSMTLPAGMTYVSGAGTGWTCTGSSAGGSCTYRAGLAPGKSAPALIVKATVTTSGDKTNTVTVTGTDDDNPANNTATETANAPLVVNPPPAQSAAVSYVFTDKACTAGVVIGSAGQCGKYGASTLGGAETKIFLTAVIDGKAATPSAKADTTVPLQFRLECLSPLLGKTGATYAGAAIPACPAATESGGDPWSPLVNVVFGKNVVSKEQVLVYKDIGQLKLHLQTGTVRAATEAFVSAPSRIVFKSIRYGTSPNPGTTKPGDKAFAPAGATLTLEVGALLADGTSYAPNFGNESPALVLGLDRSTIGGVTLEDAGILSEIGSPSWADGIRTSKAAWSEVGAINFSIGLRDPNPDASGADRKDNNYLGVTVPGSTVAVGRFHPAYFRTEAVGRFNCPANLNATDYPCPRDTVSGVNNGAVYSGQSFDVTVEAYNAANKPVKNFTGDWIREVTLHAAGTAGGAALAADFTPPAGKTGTTIAGTTAIPAAQEGDPALIRILGTARYTLAEGYSKAAHRSTRITDPATIFVRAVASDTSVAGAVEISSQRGTDEVSDEGGMLVVNGRLAVPNALGTDLLPTALGLRAEYWAGSKAGWLINRGYTEPLAAGGEKVKPISCSANFARADGSCDTNVVAAMSLKGVTKSVSMANGTGTLWLRAPGKLDKGVARTGWFTLQFDGWSWLPSTIGRVSFGSHRSPVIYVRELYF